MQTLSRMCLSPPRLVLLLSVTALVIAACAGTQTNAERGYVDSVDRLFQGQSEANAELDSIIDEVEQSLEVATSIDDLNLDVVERRLDTIHAGANSRFADLSALDAPEPLAAVDATAVTYFTSLLQWVELFGDKIHSLRAGQALTRSDLERLDTVTAEFERAEDAALREIDRYNAALEDR